MRAYPLPLGLRRARWAMARARGPGRSLLALAGLAGVAVFLCGCQIQQPQFKSNFLPAAAAPGLTAVTLTNRIRPAWLEPSTNLFRLGPGDTIQIDVTGETNTTTMVVGPDGKIYFGLLPGLDVWGLTLGQVQQKLQQGLAQYVREPPQLSVILRAVKSRNVWVLGYVQRPGVYPLAAPMTLLEAISLAGGPLSRSSFQQQEITGASDELADLRRSFVLRDGKLLPVDFQRLLEQGDLSQNIYLQPDDFVYFPPATTKVVYVLGAVAQPRAVPYRAGLTVAGAVASAYGTIEGAYLPHVAVLRGSLTHPEMAIVDYKRVIRGEANDVALQPQDIVYVPFSPYRYLVKYAQLVLDTFVDSAAINAGTAWIGVPGGGAGVFIPVGVGTTGIPIVVPPPVK
jgi:polysaccharide biosynthesis/export protein